VKWEDQTIGECIVAVLKASPEIQRLQNDAEVAQYAHVAAIGRLLALPVGTVTVYSKGKAKDPAWLAAVEELKVNADAELPQAVRLLLPCAFHPLREARLGRCRVPENRPRGRRVLIRAASPASMSAFAVAIGVKRTWRFAAHVSAYDPKWTSDRRAESRR
jgi:hypothetical protein